MSDETQDVAEDNATPDAGDEDVARVEDTENQGDANPGASVDQGVRVDSAEENDDPKSGHSPV